MNNIGKVFRWEFIKNVKSPAFLIFTFLMPLLIVAGSLVGILVMEYAAREEQEIAVIDHTGNIFPLLAERLVNTPVELSSFPAAEQERLEEQVIDEEYSGLLVISADALQSGAFPFYISNTRHQQAEILSEALNGAITAYRLQAAGLSAEQIAAGTAPVVLQAHVLDEEERSIEQFIVPLVVAFVLFFSAIFSGQILMYGVIKEKRNRIVEILLSSISSLEMMLGKIAGFGLLGLLQIAIWLTTALVAGSRFFDLSQLSITAAVVLPSLLFFLGGYLLFSSLFAALGATIKDAESGSQLQGLAIIIPMVPMFAASGIMMYPNSLWVKIFSFFPPFIPITMLLRLSSTTIPWWEIAASIIVLLVSVGLTIYFGARIFNRSILLFERTITMKDIGRMVKS